MSKLPNRRDLLVGASSFCGVAGGGGTARATGVDELSLTVDWVLDGLYAPFYLGIENGTFAKHGIRLTLNAGTGSKNTVLAVASGHSMIGMVDATVVPSAVLQGAEVKTFCAYMRSTAFGICYEPKSGINTPKDLEGKFYGDSPGSATYALWPVFMRKVGADPAKVKLVSVSPPAQWNAFFDGQFAATYTALNDSFAKVRHGGHDIAAFAFADYGINLMSKCLIADAGTLRKTDLMRRFTKAFVESLEAMRRDPLAAIKVVRRDVPKSSPEQVQIDMLRDTIDKRLYSPNTANQPLGLMAEADWTELVSTLQTAGVLKDSVAESRLYTNEFLPG